MEIYLRGPKMNLLCTEIYHRQTEIYLLQPKIYLERPEINLPHPTEPPFVPAKALSFENLESSRQAV